MFSPSDAHITTEAPRMPVRRKLVLGRKTLCFLHDIPRVAFKNMEGLAVKVLSEPINHSRQRRWASAVSRSDDARKALEAYAQASGDAQPLSSGCARAFLAQRLKKNDAAAVLPLLERTGDDHAIISYLKRKFALVEGPMGAKA